MSMPQAWVSISAIALVAVVVLVSILACTSAPTKCPAPWRLVDKTTMPSPLETLFKNKDVSELSGVSQHALRSKVVLTMSCDPLGIYQVNTITNP
jgi:hypothetical protein